MYVSRHVTRLQIPSSGSDDTSPIAEKSLGQGAEAGAADPGSTGVSRQVTHDAGKGEGEGAARKGEGGGGEAREGGSGSA